MGSEMCIRDSNNVRNKKEMFPLASNSTIPSGIGDAIEDNTKPKGRNITINNHIELPRSKNIYVYDSRH